MAASRKTLGGLHEALAAYFKTRLDTVTTTQVDDNGEEVFVLPLQSAELGHIVSFLKNNNVTATPDSESMAELQSEFTDEYTLRRKEAAEAIVQTSPEDVEQASWFS